MKVDCKSKRVELQDRGKRQVAGESDGGDIASKPKGYGDRLKKHPFFTLLGAYSTKTPVFPSFRGARRSPFIPIIVALEMGR